jgi:hypothetical protein
MDSKTVNQQAMPDSMHRTLMEAWVPAVLA